MIKVASILVVGSTMLALSAEAREGPVVNVEQGRLRGNIGTSRNGRLFHEFLGVPYGKISRRFDLSQPADGWGGVRDASKAGPACLQYNILLRRVLGEENCLFLNVYTPKLFQKSQGLLPVMVFIHGGGFFQGLASEFGGKYLMSHEVVYVAMNYRLGSFGFLNAEVEGASGNMGLKDQILALKWVKRNILQFGGNPNLVTIFGESSGGGAVSLLTLSPMAKGLFQNAISQSGTALCCFVDRKEDPVGEAKRLATLLDCSTSDPNLMVECLRGTRAKDVVTATIPTHNCHPYFDTSSVPQFGASVEKLQADPSTVFMPKAPLALLQEGKFNRVPWIVGVNEQEGILIAAPGPFVMGNETMLRLLNKEWSRIAPSFLFLKRSTDSDGDFRNVSSSVRKFYFGIEDEMYYVSKENRQSLVDLYGDRYFTECTREAAKLYAKHAPVFLYSFKHKADFSMAIFLGWKFNSKLKPPTHFDELRFFFDFPVIPYAPGIPKGHAEEKFSEKMIKLWLSFAENGRPTEWGSKLINWPPISETDEPLKWMSIGQTDLHLQPENPELSKRLDFWTEVNSFLRSDSA